MLKALLCFRINVTDILEFFPSDDSSSVRFIWASEETGWRHLYLITALVFSASSNIPIEDYSDCNCPLFSLLRHTLR